MKSSFIDFSEIFKRTFKFGVPTLISLFFPFLIARPMSHTYGVDVFISWSIGSSFGSILSQIILWGWPILGPSIVAGVDEKSARETLLQSFAFRLFLFLLLFFPGIIYCLNFGGTNKIMSLFGYSTSIITSLGLNWWLISRNKPKAIIIFDTAPRFIAALLGGLAMYLKFSLYLFPVIQMSLIIISYFLAYKKYKPYDCKNVISKFSIIETLKKMSSGALITITFLLYSQIVQPILVLVNPEDLKEFITVNTIYGYWIVTTIIVASVFQNIVNKNKFYEKKFKLVFLIFLVLGTFMGALFPLVGPFISETMLSFKAGNIYFILFALYYMTITINTSLGTLYLIPDGQSKYLSKITMYIAVISAFFMYPVCKLFHGIGAGVILVVGELLMGLICGYKIIKTRKSIPK